MYYSPTKMTEDIYRVINCIYKDRLYSGVLKIIKQGNKFIDVIDFSYRKLPKELFESYRKEYIKSD